MKHLTMADRTALAGRLDEMRRRVMDELQCAGPQLEAGMLNASRETRTHADDAEAERADDVHFAEIEVDRMTLQEIEHAQKRLAEGLYGLCIECGVEIPRDRLLAQPAAIRCAACQTAAESRSRSRR